MTNTRIRDRLHTAYAASALVVVAWALASVGIVSAYVGQNPYIVQLEASARDGRCDGQVSITATYRGSETGEVVQGQSVQWDLKVARSPADSVAPARTITNAQGQVTVVLRFGPVEGVRTVRAVALRDWPETIDISCHGGVPEQPPTPTPTATPVVRPTVTPTRPPGSSTPPGSTTPGATRPPGSSTAPGASDAPNTTPGPGESSPPGSVTPGSSTVPTDGPGTTPGIASPGLASLAPGQTPVAVAQSSLSPSSAPGAGPSGSAGAAATPTSPDMTPLALVAVAGIGLAALGFVFVKRR